MKTLILMRHCKSSWDTPGPDKNRLLNDRGRKSAKALGNWLRQHGLLPTEILCSSAARTLETTQRLKISGAFDPIDALYLASPETMLDIVRQAQSDTVLLVGHNPGIAELADWLAVKPTNHPRFADYPTGATTVFECDISSWADLHPNANNIAQFIIPREL